MSAMPRGLPPMPGPTLLDRLVTFVSPIRELRRHQPRAALAGRARRGAPGASRDSAGTGRRTSPREPRENPAARNLTPTLEHKPASPEGTPARGYRARCQPRRNNGPEWS